jgi:transposase InsO family protein
LLVDRVVIDRWPVKEAADAAGVTPRTASKWLARWRAEGPPGLLDRSSATKTVANKTDPQTVELILALRRIRFTSPQIAELIDRPLSTICAVLKRSGMGKLGRLGLEPAQRYERARPGELLHIDVKKLGRIRGGAGHRMLGRGPGRHGGRGAGWDYVHIAIDDATRLAYAEVLTDEKATTAIGFLRRAVAFYARHGIQIERLLTDNGSAYRSKLHLLACAAIGIRHLRTRPYRPQTNGKAERFIRTMLDGWAYGAIYGSSAERTAALDGWLWHYNHRRRHSGISRATPITRLNNLLGTYT